MRLTELEQEKLMISVAGMVAEKRKKKGLKLNQPEAVALITNRLLEGAREGKSVEDLMNAGATWLTKDDVMDGIAELIPMIQVEATFPDGTKLITVTDPIR